MNVGSIPLLFGLWLLKDTTISEISYYGGVVIKTNTKGSVRLKTILNKGTKCVACGVEGTHFTIDRERNGTLFHLNLRTADGTLMTKDHIIPKSKGGKKSLYNMQPMCATCNTKKGNKLVV